MENIEEWRSIPGYNNGYEVSNLGRVKSLDRKVYRKDGSYIKKYGRLLIQSINNFGYNRVEISIFNKGKEYFVHRLVAMVFLVFDENKQVNHINGVKTDNRVCNLEMVTQSENIKHRLNVLRQNPPTLGMLNSTNSKKVVQLNLDGDLIINRFPSGSEAARKLSISDKCEIYIRRAAQKKGGVYGGYRWRYEKDMIEEAV